MLDTTLRDGAQGEGISFSIDDKIAVMRVLDELGVQWIEAGNPGSNIKDREFFRVLSGIKLEHAQICAFGATRKKGIPVNEDTQLQSLLGAETETVVIVGKSWDFQAREVLGVSLEENLAMIFETIRFVRDRGRQVIFDAEHFFDGWQYNSEYSQKTLQAAVEAGAQRLVLCDTNGGTFPDSLSATIRAVRALFPVSVLGIHAHNDSGLACANALAAVGAGCTHVQGTLLGFGERCGNTALAVLIPNLELKSGFTCLPADSLEHLTALSRQIAEIANVVLPATMPYIGAHAFSHKAGMHADGILKTSTSFEHIEPSLVGNDRHFLLSEVGGRSVIAARARNIDPKLKKEDPVIESIAARVKKLEAEGWQFEGADASFELLVRQELGQKPDFFTILGYRVASEHPARDFLSCCQAWIKVRVDGVDEIAAAEGNGPVHALDAALRRALSHFYPQLKRIRLNDYKVRVIDGTEATAARVRVLIESTDGLHSWTTVGVSEDIIDASRAALVDSIVYTLFATDLLRKENL